jgi:hypothetical protein
MQTLKTVLGSCLLGFLPVITLAGEPTQKPPVPTSLCRVDEQILFTCEIIRSAKVISLCSSTNLDNRRGYLQYRFGKPGALELQFPRERANTQLAFRYAHYFRAQVDRTEVTFDNGDYNYVLFDYYEGDMKPATFAAGVRVSKHGANGQETELQCQGKASSKLGSLETVIPRDPDNALNQ